MNPQKTIEKQEKEICIICRKPLKNSKISKYNENIHAKCQPYPASIN